MNQILILHIPHSSEKIPDKAGYVVSEEKFKKEILSLTDWYTDDLFSFTDGVPIIADFNRIFCDIERLADDNQETMSSLGLGVAYTKNDDGSELRNVSPELKIKILNNYYFPHHKSLTSAVDEQIKLYGRALIIDCHAFRYKPFKRVLRAAMPRTDFRIGTDAFHTPRALFKYAAVILKALGYTVEINVLSSCSMVPTKYHLADKRVSCVMIEINRDLYLMPGTNKKNNEYNQVKLNIQKLLSGISKNNFYFKVLPLVKSHNR